MNEKNTGGAAFPRPFSSSRGGMFDFGKQDGMSLRDYMAAKALQIIMHQDPHSDYIVVASGAYRMADAMLEARGE